jgi:hypothetical protein
MPRFQPKMQMFLPNGNAMSSQMAALSYSANIASVPKTNQPTPLNTAMIGRIHNAKSGCGSCGRK